MAGNNSTCAGGDADFSRLFMAGNIRDGTGRDCSQMFGGKKIEDETGRDGKMKNIVGWMGRAGTVGVKFLDGTGQYSTMILLYHHGTGR